MCWTDWLLPKNIEYRKLIKLSDSLEVCTFTLYALIYIFSQQRTELELSDGKIKEYEAQTGLDINFYVRNVGLYLVIETDIGLTVMWDRKTTVRIILQPGHMVSLKCCTKLFAFNSNITINNINIAIASTNFDRHYFDNNLADWIYIIDFQGEVCGLCGNYNGKDDFTTQGSLHVSDVMEFVNSWKVQSTCPDAKPDFDPCSARPNRHTWAKLQCSIIKSDTFKECHDKVH